MELASGSPMTRPSYTACGGVVSRHHCLHLTDLRRHLSEDSTDAFVGLHGIVVGSQRGEVREVVRLLLFGEELVPLVRERDAELLDPFLCEGLVRDNPISCLTCTGRNSMGGMDLGYTTSIRSDHSVACIDEYFSLSLFFFCFDL